MDFLIQTFASMLLWILGIYQYVVLFAVLISFVSPDPHNPIVRLLRQLTEPVFYQARRILPTGLLRTGIDFSPLVVLFGIYFLRSLCVRLMY